MKTAKYLPLVLASAAVSARAAAFTFEDVAVALNLTSLVTSDSGLTATITRPGASFNIVAPPFSKSPAPTPFGTRSLTTSAGSQPLIVDFSNFLSSASVSFGALSGQNGPVLYSLSAYSGSGGTGTLLDSQNGTFRGNDPGKAVFTSSPLTARGAMIKSVVVNGGLSLYQDNIIATPAAAVSEEGATWGLLAAATFVLVSAALIHDGLSLCRREITK